MRNRTMRSDDPLHRVRFVADELRKLPPTERDAAPPHEEVT
jgi:hypothetical protein